MRLAEDILRAAERNLMAMPVELREAYKAVVPTRATLWPLAVLLASWHGRERTVNGVDLGAYWSIMDSLANSYPMLEVFLKRVKEATSDLDFYAAGAVYALLIKAVGLDRLKLLLSQPIVDRIRAAVPLPKDFDATRPDAPDGPDRARRLSESPIRRFDAPRFGTPRTAKSEEAPSSNTPTDPELLKLPEPDPETVAAGVLALRGWSPEQIAEKLKGPRRA